MYARTININKIEITSDIEEVVIFCQKKIKEFWGIKLRYKKEKIRNKEYYIIRSENREKNLKIISMITKLYRNRAKIKNLIELIKGIFIIIGDLYNPKEKYYLEFSHQNKELIKILQQMLQKIGFQFKYKIERKKYIIYTTNSVVIEDFLTYIGASKMSLEIMNIKVYKNLRNNVNRLVNCETSNINKTITASTNQIKNIKKIIDKKGIEYLENDLREIAEKRLENPEMSLVELVNILSFNISKSSLNYRLKKIEKIAENL